MNPLSIAAGAAKGFRDASQNLFNLQVATYKLKQDKERSDRDFKIQDLQLKNLEEETSPENVATRREMTNIDKQKAKLGLQESEVTIEATKAKLKEEALTHKANLAAAIQYLPEITSRMAGQEMGGRPPRGSSLTGAITTLPKGVEFEFGGIKYGGTAEDKEWKPKTKEEFEWAEGVKASQKSKNIAEPYDLTGEQQIQARALSRKLYGVRGAENGLGSIYEEMRNGKSIDQIEDTLRYAGQSPEFVGPVRDAAQTILIGKSADASQKTMDYIDDLLSKGDTEGVKSQLKRISRINAGAEESRSVIGKERTIKLLDEIQGDLNNLEKMGINTNIFTGTQEQIASKIGMVANSEARKVATKISTAIQNYRRSMTGVQFGMPENLEYKVMFPSISRIAKFNTANIDALKEVLTGDLDNFYALSMGEDTYNKIFEKEQKPVTSNNENKILMVAPDGSNYNVDASEVGEAEKNGWKKQ